MRNNGALHSPLKNLRKDLYAVARDAEALLKATAEVTNERVQEVRERTEKTVRAATSAASGGSSSSLHSAGSTPRVRGAAFLGVRRRTGARLRFAVVDLAFVATRDPPCRRQFARSNQRIAPQSNRNCLRARGVASAMRVVEPRASNSHIQSLRGRRSA